MRSRRSGTLAVLLALALVGGACGSPTAPKALFTKAGTGASVFEVPDYVSRVRITASFNGTCENFIVWIGSDLLVNEILGSCSVASSRNYEGTHTTKGGLAEIKSATGISWTFTEVR